MSHPAKVYSAPGKALVAGGYLVLFPEFSALSIALESRMHAAVFPNDGSKQNLLRIASPQFNSQWEYPSRSGTHPNPFIDACYDTVTAYFERALTGSVNIWSDGGFHSQAEANQSHYPGDLRRFAYHGKPIIEVAKTGLGSSAALVVVVVAALVRLAGLEPTENLRLVHNLAQVAHSVAQRKVGSGFDVATAVYGSIIYSRFDAGEIPSTLEPTALHSSIEKQWGMRAEPCALPSALAIVMGDVAMGSETPGMVRQVLKWRAENPKAAEDLFNRLHKANMALASALQGPTTSGEQITTAISSVRTHLKELTKASGVPIEPDSQSKLLDSASRVDGVLGGVVPGAGGEDAVCLLVDTRQASIEQVLEDLRKIEGVSWLHLSAETTGLKAEVPSSYAFNK